MFVKVLFNYLGSDYISNITALLRNVKGCNEVFIHLGYKENLSFIWESFAQSRKGTKGEEGRKLRVAIAYGKNIIQAGCNVFPNRFGSGKDLLSFNSESTNNYNTYWAFFNASSGVSPWV